MFYDYVDRFTSIFFQKNEEKLGFKEVDQLLSSSKVKLSNRLEAYRMP